MASRWPDTLTMPVLADEGPRGMVDLWNAVPPGAAMSTTGLAALVESNQQAITGRFAALGQQVAVATGVQAGYRPEILALLDPVLSPGAAAELARIQSFTSGLRLGELVESTGVATEARRVFSEVLNNVMKGLAIGGSMVAVVPAVGQIVAIVAWVTRTILQAKSEADAAAQESLEQQLKCRPPFYTAAMDAGYSGQAMQVLAGGDWTRVFLPEARLFDPDYVPWPGIPVRRGNSGEIGPTCCPSALDRYTMVIAPIGIGFGNRGQSFYPPVLWPRQSAPGLGCVPMLADPVHRAFVAGGQGSGAGTAGELGKHLPELGAVGVYAWRTLWNRGPATWAVDAEQLADAWEEYIRVMVRDIATNPRPWTITGEQGLPLCADAGGGTGQWDTHKRLAAARGIAARFGAPVSTAAPDGIHTFDSATPVMAWKRFGEQQRDLLSRLVVAYADASTCSPAWALRVAQAQRDLLTSPAVCRVELEAVPDLDLREQIRIEQRARGVSCWAVAGQSVQWGGGKVSATEGPSLEPLGSSGGRGGSLPTIPALPKPPRVGAGGGVASPSSSSGGGAELVIGGAVIALLAGAFLARKRRKRKR